jgi:hypothetical protein
LQTHLRSSKRLYKLLYRRQRTKTKQYPRNRIEELKSTKMRLTAKQRKYQIVKKLKMGPKNRDIRKLIINQSRTF